MIEKLVVTSPFLSFVLGDIVVDAAKIHEIMENGYAKSVRPISPPAPGGG